MDIEITDTTDDTIQFDLDGATPALANALRRTLIGDVPTLAIEDVTVTRNTSGLFDEIVAHRLGLLPWRFNPDKYTFREECECDGEGCPQCTVHMALQQEGPGPVIAGDIAVADDEVESANPESVVLTLNEEGAVDLEAEAILGYGKDHAKWQAANAAYSYDDDAETFHFTVESVSGIAPRAIVLQALDRLDEHLDAFEDAVDAAE